MGAALNKASGPISRKLERSLSRSRRGPCRAKEALPTIYGILKGLEGSSIFPKVLTACNSSGVRFLLQPSGWFMRIRIPTTAQAPLFFSIVSIESPFRRPPSMAPMAMLVPILIILFALPCWTAYNIYLNYRRALTIGLPIVITPVDPLNPLWIFARPYLVDFLSHLPFGLGEFAGYSYLGWAWKDQYAMQARYGDAFTIVTSRETQVFVADAKAADEILTRRKAFFKNTAINAPFNIFGRNVSSVEGEDWQRHRRITTPPFNEQNSGLVWSESLRQAREMLQLWVSKGKEGITRVSEDSHLLALHVLTSAGFGQSYSFRSELETPAAGHNLSYRAALHIVLSHFFLTVVIESGKLPHWVLPTKLRAVKGAVAEFKRYMVEMVDKERAATSQGSKSSANLMSSLVRASDEAGRAEEKGVRSKNGMTDDEIYGNLFVYNFAGHETTANALTYSVALLTCYPQWQEWLGEEINRVFGSESDIVEKMQYEEAFPQLKRCLALMVCSDP